MTRAAAIGESKLAVPVGRSMELTREPGSVGGSVELTREPEPEPVGGSVEPEPEPEPESESAGGFVEPTGKSEPVGGSAELAELCRQAGRLVARTAGPLRRIRLRSGDALLEIEWHGGEANSGPGTGAGTPGGSAPNAAPFAVPAVTGAAIGTDGRRTVLAPMVGTYYQAAEPGGAPFVEVGDKVEPGQVVCIVEAMKLMNEVVADQVGRVVEVLVHDGEPVEFGQPLIALVPA
ncbi:acetyl-CoA carboxylase biotin carboxyl carrier protein [Plantactinospora soyae]|uniref:Biotin carboxyl carrier protein of acetyl-CoA carboxylase n=1 Tax=Plantactinospora soyae TaxID=1544732 RepID=A0A927MB56_9ACTN|nr:acetyl-CoA carboxylase biotin carboxyl carrier protein [Plantactinospora soyae]MBE1491209.1 acetyl-CoA carboxylase biotin carboxyl carrier protein [Plantactinospora soyae]